MTHILVHPQEVATYGIQATAHFGTIVDQLAVLTNMINDVVFEGEAAFQFRTETGTLITDFNKQINDSMVAMVTNVQNAVGNIQASMQGTRVVLTIPEPRMGPEADGRNTENAEMDSDALASLDIEGPFGLISEAFLAHQKALLKDVTWLGQQGNAARDAVITQTTTATGACTTYSGEFRRVIDAQVAATEEADARTPASA